MKNIIKNLQRNFSKSIFWDLANDEKIPKSFAANFEKKKKNLN